MKPRIVFTGGGTAGHVTPNLALIEALQPEGWQIHYIGSKASIEQSMLQALNIPFYAIDSGKLRRYFSWQNFFDPFKIMLGFFQAYGFLRKLRPDLVFSKGGFVAVPVVLAAKLCKIPVVAHESDRSPGLANRLCLPFVSTLCLSFPTDNQHFKTSKRVEVTGSPIRPFIFKGNKRAGLKMAGFTDAKPCLLVMGGSQGSSHLNAVIRKALAELTKVYQVIHLCGKGKVDQEIQLPGYLQLEYANEELADLLAAADLVVSRAGANTLYELLALKKPHLLIPLSAKVSRGDQIQNASYFKNLGVSTVIDDEKLTAENLIVAIRELYANQEAIIAKMAALGVGSATARIIGIFESVIRGGVVREH